MQLDEVSSRFSRRCVNTSPHRASDATVPAFAASARRYLRTSDVDDPIILDLLTSWIPKAIALDAIAAGVLALGLRGRSRWLFLAGHVLVYPSLVAILIALAHGPFPEMDGFQRDPAHLHLGLAYLFVMTVIAAHLAAGVVLITQTRNDRWVAATLGVVALAVYIAVSPYQPGVRDLVSDEPHYLLFTQSLWLDHDLALDDDYRRVPYMNFWPQLFSDVHAVRTPSGLYPFREPGFPLLLVVPFGLDGRYGVLRELCVLGAALVVQLYLLLRDSNVSRHLAAGTVLIVAFTHPLITYTTQVFPELAVALGSVTAARLLRRGTDSPPLALALASVVAGGIVWLTLRALPLAIGLVLCAAVFAALRARSLRHRAARLAAAVGPFLVVMAALALLDESMFGDWTPGAAARLFYASKPFVLEPTWAPQIGGLGLFIDRVFGLFRNAPEYIVMLAGIVPLARLVRCGQGTPIVLATGSALYVAAIANFFYWHADFAPAPRYLVAILPALALTFALGLEQLSRLRTPGRIASALVIAASTLITYLFLAHPSLMYNWGTFEEATAWSPGALGLFMQRWFGLDPGALYPSLWWVDGGTWAVAACWAVIALSVMAMTLVTTRAVDTGV